MSVSLVHTICASYSTKNIALQCSKRLTNPTNPTENPLLPKNIPKIHLQRLPNHQFKRKFNIGENTDKNADQNALKHVISSEKNSGGLSQTLPLVKRGTPFSHLNPHPMKPSGSASAFSRISVRFMPLPIVPEFFVLGPGQTWGKNVKNCYTKTENSSSCTLSYIHVLLIVVKHNN